MNSVASAQYQLICFALNSTSHDRLIYDTNTKVFMVASRALAKTLNNRNYHTDLPQLKSDIEDYIQTNGIEKEQKTAIETAFKERKKRLKSRIVIRHRDRRAAAVAQLRTIKQAIKKVQIAKLQSEVIQQQQQNNNLRKTQTALVSTSNRTVPPSKNPTPPPPIPSGPPPPSIPPLGGPPPPPPTMGGGSTTKTFAHRKLTTEADTLGTFQGEPTRPTIVENHDLGRPAAISQNIRQQYASAIESFILGTPYTVTQSHGLSSSTQTKHEENGLNHTIQRIEEAINTYKETLEQLEGKEAQARDVEKKIHAVKERIKNMLNANKEGTDFTLYTKGTKKGTLGPPVKFIPDTTYQTYLKKFEGIPEEQRKKIPLFPETKTLSYQINIQQKLLEKLKQEQNELQEETKTLINEIEKTKAQEEHEIPFIQWEPLLNQKITIRDSWLSVKGNLESGASQQQGKSLPAESEYLPSYLEDPDLSLSLEESSFLQTLPQAQQGSYLSNPQIFFENLTDEGGL
ncbi:MAG: hypothetical protein K940chlam9_00130 [Chlamydiae bacterium]|nr:hypothetical protein [Chlamydiota bacterium]